MSVFEWDDFGANHIISDMCQSHDCRDQLDKLHILNPAFKCTLFAIPGEMTAELINWCVFNSHWVELAVHGFFHTSNYECEQMTYEQFDELMQGLPLIEDFFVKVFRAPGWQISEGCYMWLAEHNWIVADQSYNNDRRPPMKAYVNHDGQFSAFSGEYGLQSERVHTPVEAYHGHTWDVGEKGNQPNGIYEDFEKVADLVKNADSFQFVSELFV